MCKDLEKRKGLACSLEKALWLGVKRKKERDGLGEAGT